MNVAKNLIWVVIIFLRFGGQIMNHSIMVHAAFARRKLKNNCCEVVNK